MSQYGAQYDHIIADPNAQDPATQPISATPPIPDGNVPPADYNATQAPTTDWLTTFENAADPTQHPLYYVVGGLVIVGLLLLSGGKKKMPTTLTKAARSITISD